ncbi:hypothetical protein AKJ09_02561 [Labilithrix luteola]|uniref:Tetratricopeptide repeat protein n=1 Tax=Labilithrix luteola TaxID=1391654 RepID=A0A0K1PQU3_9BACT|nr:hypothetical protein [Labilithrix luteola]AKU95897.1 hypothetical protein AKJ09_02561 [Labilithrix luteola]
MKNMLLLAAALTVVSVPAIANAQSPTTPAADEQTAQTLSDQAYEAYEKGDFSKAISQYLESYKLVPTAEILYNIASIYEKKLNDPKLAIEYYRRHNAATDAKAELVGKATSRIAALQAQIDNPNGSKSDLKTLPESSGKHESGSGSTLKTIGIVTGTIGIVGLGVGAVTGVMASGKHGDAKDAGCSGSTCPTEDARDKEKSAADMATISTITFIAGGALLAGGIIMYLAAPKENSTSRAFRVAPQVDMHGGGLSVLGRF